jgi:phosphatidylinositol alpha-1,6-mannosyltransferase
MKSVVYLTPGVFDKGGISRYSRYQIRALRELCGADAVSVISLNPPRASGFEELFPVDFASSGSPIAGRALFVAATVAAVLAERPRAIWSAHLHLAPLALALARATGATAVLNVYAAEVWTNVTRHRVAALRRTDYVISDCHNTAAYLLERGLRGPERTVVHWDCVDLARFSPGDPGDVLARYGVAPHAPPGLGEERPVTVLSLGRMAPNTEYKGYDRLLAIFARIPASAPIRLVLAGDGARRAELQARAQAPGLAGRVHFTGSVREQDLPDLYRACDVFSLVTHRGHGVGEGVPLTPLEAAACAKPILVGDQDGSHEAVEDGVSGFVVPSFALDAQRARILELAGDAALRARMGAAGRARIEREHGYERFRARVAELLAEMGLHARGIGR